MNLFLVGKETRFASLWKVGRLLHNQNVTSKNSHCPSDTAKSTSYSEGLFITIWWYPKGSSIFLNSFTFFQQFGNVLTCGNGYSVAWHLSVTHVVINAHSPISKIAWAPYKLWLGCMYPDAIRWWTCFSCSTLLGWLQIIQYPIHRFTAREYLHGVHNPLFKGRPMKNLFLRTSQSSAMIVCSSTRCSPCSPQPLLSSHYLSQHLS